MGISEGSDIRAVEVPGDKVIAAYIELDQKARVLYRQWAESDYRDRQKQQQCQLAQGRVEGFRLAAELYCPSVPGYSCTSGRLIMSAELHAMEQEANDGDQ